MPKGVVSDALIFSHQLRLIHANVRCKKTESIQLPYFLDQMQLIGTIFTKGPSVSSRVQNVIQQDWVRVKLETSSLFWFLKVTWQRKILKRALLQGYSPFTYTGFTCDVMVGLVHNCYGCIVSKCSSEDRLNSTSLSTYVSSPLHSPKTTGSFLVVRRCITHEKGNLKSMGCVKSSAMELLLLITVKPRF